MPTNSNDLPLLVLWFRQKHPKKEDFSPEVPKKRAVGSILDDLKPIVDQWLEEDRRNWHKQRHTAKRIWERLREA